jgi:hypothetical protein
MGEDEPEDGEWLSVAAAAKRLGVSPRAIRGRIDRGTIRWKPAGNIGKLVLVRPEDTAAEDQGGASTDEQRGVSKDEMDRLREELTEARISQARAEERAAALRELVDELRAELAAARRPWWRKLTGG